MAKLTPGALLEFAKTIRNDGGNSGGAKLATVTRVDNGVIYVRIPGGVDETPIATTGAVLNVGDTVSVSMDSGKLRAVGNVSNPAISDKALQRALSTISKTVIQVEKTADEAEQVAKATNQHFWEDDNGAHVTDVSKDEWARAVADGFSDLSATKQYSNLLMNSLGLLLRSALNNLVSITRSAVAFYDGAGNAASNIVARFGLDGVQVGKANNSTFALVKSNSFGIYYAGDDGNTSHFYVGATDGSTDWDETDHRYLSGDDVFNIPNHTYWLVYGHESMFDGTLSGFLPQETYHWAFDGRCATWTMPAATNNAYTLSDGTTKSLDYFFGAEHSGGRNPFAVVYEDEPGFVRVYPQMAAISDAYVKCAASYEELADMSLAGPINCTAVTVGGHDSPIGTVTTNSTDNISRSGTDIDTMTDGASISLTAGTYIITGFWTFNSGGSSGTRNQQVAVGTSSSAYYDRVRVYAAASNFSRLEVTVIKELSTTTTVKVMGSASQAQSSTSKDSSSITAVRIA